MFLLSRIKIFLHQIFLVTFQQIDLVALGIKKDVHKLLETPPMAMLASKSKLKTFKKY